ncbi:glycosyltransferase family 2 protein [Sphingobacterium faecale]|uniref:Glycosyltransferase family 2 protein n=1 Tax=Sphingobacterium faecale TaxID=2803775 RepID=A0ABS1R2D7_9SPHI|nr:glycosyltransferase family A protein [Sphingobacterium faecale]MBL1408202.1 glycosyltransferase family 2 protein [Sphingobacterium faecale]
MLPTFILQKDISIDLSRITSKLNINPNNYKPKDTLFTGLKFAIEWAINHDEDVIYCICGKNALTTFDIKTLEKVIYDAVPEGINLIYIDAQYKQSIIINKDCKIIEGIEEASSFILAQPAYRFVLAVLEGREEFPDMDWLAFLRIIAPHSFAIGEECHSFAKDRIKFHIVSPFRNVAAYIQDYLPSVNKQIYSDFHIYLIDDCSTDGSSVLIDKAPNITKIINAKRKYALQNILDVLLKQHIGDEDIICLLDADDRLPHKYVLSILHSLYQNRLILLTYGSMQHLNGHRRFGNSYTEEEFENLRKSPWKSSHMRTFRYSLFKELIRQDPNLYNLRDAEGQILRMPYDMALLFPLMELAGYEHTKFINTIMYEYRLHENNDQYANRDEQYAGEKEIRSKRSLKKFSFNPST